MMRNIFVLMLLTAISIHANARFKCDTISISPILIESCTSWHDNGKIESSYILNNHEFDGIYKEWHPNGTIKSIFSYKNGCLVDSSYFFFSSGRLRSLSKNRGCNNRGWSLSFLENGDTAMLSTPELSKSFHPNRRPKSLIRYDSLGRKHGLSEEWREDGTRKDSTVYEQGNIIEIRTYFTTGKLRYWVSKFDRSTGFKKLEAAYYDPAGKKCGEIKNGNGTYILWSDDAKERWLETYTNGEETASRKLEPGENPKVK
jgi:antitoxin component YwqK of YwqJK toxin-antitoxin module